LVGSEGIMTTSAKLLVSVDDAAPTSGAVTVAVGNTIVLSGENTVGWTQQLFEIYDYPVGFALPDGWSDSGNGTYFYSLTAFPPVFTISPWGKYMLRLTVNDGIDGDNQANPALVDATTALTAASPNGLRDLGYLETNQFNQQREWTGDQKANLRVLDAAIGGGGGGGGITPPAGDIGGTTQDPTVQSIQGLPTSSGTSAVAGDLAIVNPSPPWVGLTDITYDGAYLWVADGGTAANGLVNVFKTDGTQILGQYPLPSPVSFCNRILFNGTYFFVGVGVSTGTHYLYVLNTSGEVVGVGSATANDTSDQGARGLAFDGAGNIWTADNTNGLQCYSIATLVSNGPGTPTAPHATYGLANCNDVCFDGTYLYAVNDSFGPSGLTVYQVNPSTATLHASAAAPRQISALFFDSSLGTNIYGSASTGLTTTELVIISPTLTFTTIASSHTSYDVQPGRLATDGTGDFVYVSLSDKTVDIYYPAVSEWYANYAASSGFGGNGYEFGVVHGSGYNVWAVEGATPCGIQEFTFTGAESSFIGPLALQYSKKIGIGGDVSEASGLGELRVTGIQGQAISPATAPNQVPVSSGSGLYIWTPTDLSTIVTPQPQRPASDSNTLLDYRFNETTVGVLVNHGSYGTSSSPVGPALTTTTAAFTQPAVKSTVTVQVATSAGYSAGEILLIGPRGSNGAGANYYYCTAVGSNTLTVENLGISGGSSPGTAIPAGSTVAPNLDLLVCQSTSGPTLLNKGPYDWCQYFYGAASCNWSNYGIGTGGCPDFNGLTQVSVHVLFKPNVIQPSTSTQIFGYSVEQSWGGGSYQQLGPSMQIYNGAATVSEWGFVGGGQSFSVVGNPTTGQAGSLGAGEFQLMSMTLDSTVVAGGANLYKNGQLVGTFNLNTTGVIEFGNGGYWYVANPNSNGGDTGDNTNGLLAMCRFENTVRSPEYIQAMWESIVPGSNAWPVP